VKKTTSIHRSKIVPVPKSLSRAAKNDLVKIVNTVMKFDEYDLRLTLGLVRSIANAPKIADGAR